MAKKGRLLTGARAKLTISGVPVGYARTISVNRIYALEDVEAIGNIEVEEHVVTGYRVTGNFGFFRLVGETLRSRGWIPSTGANAEEHLLNVLTLETLGATIEDIKTGKIITKLQRLIIEGSNWTINARGIVGEDCNWRAIREKDESEVA